MRIIELRGERRPIYTPDDVLIVPRDTAQVLLNFIRLQVGWDGPMSREIANAMESYGILTIAQELKRILEPAEEDD
jgi:hypothetical protein